MTVPLDPYMSLRALAPYAGMSTRKLRDLLTDPAHPLHHYRIAGKLLVRRSDYGTWAARYRRVGSVNVDAIVRDVIHSVIGPHLEAS